MNPLMRTMQQQQAQRNTPPQNQKRPNTRGGKKGQRRPPPPIRHMSMTSSIPDPSITPMYTNAIANYDDRLTHLAQLFPNIDNPVIMDILGQNSGNIQGATRDLFQLTNPDSIDSIPQVSTALCDTFELPPCYDDLDEEFSFTPDSIDKSLPVVTRGKSIEEPIMKHHQHADLKRYNTTMGLIRPQAVASKDYLLKWNKGQTCWLSVNGKNVLIGPLPDDFLRVKKTVPVRTQSVPNATTVFSPINNPPLKIGPSDEISRAREGRISPFRLPLKLEELDVPPDPTETEAQLEEDRRLAAHLQNVEFVKQVKLNQELYRQVRQAADIDSTQPIYSQATLKRMDKATKKKLAKLAKKLAKDNV